MLKILSINHICHCISVIFSLLAFAFFWRLPEFFLTKNDRKMPFFNLKRHFLTSNASALC